MGQEAALRAERRSVRKAMGETAAAAVADLEGKLQRTHLEHKALARQLHELEQSIGSVRAARGSDKAIQDAALRRFGAKLDELAGVAEQFENLKKRFEHVDRASMHDGSASFSFRNMAFRQRLQWLFTGRFSYVPPGE